MKNYKEQYDSIYALLSRAGAVDSSKIYGMELAWATEAEKTGEVTVSGHMDTVVYDYSTEVVAIRLVQVYMIRDIAANAYRKMLRTKGSWVEEAIVASEIKSMNTAYNDLIQSIKENIPPDRWVDLPIATDDIAVICENCETVEDLQDITITGDGSFIV